jgi:hypothetical protein
VCILDVLAHEGQRHFQGYSDIPKEMASRIGCLVITETQRPHKVFEIVASTQVDKEILAPAFMKIKKSNFQSGRV